MTRGREWVLISYPERMAHEEDWRETAWVARALSTRPVQIPGERHITRVSRQAMESALAQARTGFIPIMVEHLDYLPPIGRWCDGRLVDCDDGETELELHGRRLAQLAPVAADPPDPLSAVGDVQEVAVPSDLSIVLRLEARNFSPSGLAALHQTAPIPVREEHRWSELPPLIWTLAIPVMWGAVKFAGAFFEELGKVSAKAFSEWIRRMWDSSKEPQRDRILAVQFEISDGSTVTAFVPVRYDSPDQEAVLARALEHLGDVATFVGAQKEQHMIARLQRAALLFDGQDWHLAWWTDGESVYRTHWFTANQPDPSRFLGRPLFEPQDADPEG